MPPSRLAEPPEDLWTPAKTAKPSLRFSAASGAAGDSRSGSPCRTACDQIRRAAPAPKALRRQLLFTVNAVLGALLAALLVADYHRGLDAAVHNHLLALRDEATAVHGAVRHLSSHGRGPVQDYIDDVCGRMSGVHSPWHHIVVDRGPAGILVARHHGREPDAIVEAIRRAAAGDGRAAFGGRTLVVGTVDGNGLTVHVAESTDDIRRSARAGLLTELAAAAGLGLLAAAIVNAVLVAAVARPLERLAAAVREIARGRLGLRVRARECLETHTLAEAIDAMSRALAEADRDRRSQMAQAQRLQEHLLLRDASVPDLALAHLFRPAEGVAGDYFDVVPLAGGGWLICVADVAGHGVPAALAAAMLKTLLMQAGERHGDPAGILADVDQRFAAVMTPGTFATMFLGAWRPSSGCLAYASAGHEPGLLLSGDGSIRELGATGLPLGIGEDAHWEAGAVTMRAGDRLLLYTDGVVEATSLDMLPFGRARLKRLFTEGRGLPVDEFVRDLGRQFEPGGGFRQADDLAVVACEFLPTGPGT